MSEWLESIAGPAYATAMMWTLGALLLLLVILLLIKIVRNLTFGTFVSGGRNRKARLAVMDAAAVDSHRRLVLVRRDDVEHLILIGGQTDIVVEQNIRLAPAARRPGDEPAREHAVEERPRSAPAAVPPPPAAPRTVSEADIPPAEPARAVEPARTVEPARPAPPARPLEPSPPRTTARPAEPPPVPASRPAYQASAYQPSATQPSATQPQPRAPMAPTPRPAAAPSTTAIPPLPAERPAPPQQAANASATPSSEPSHDLDDALRQELEITLDSTKPRTEGDLPESVEDEMSKLLGELSRSRR